jgi:hypothetical protein
VPCAERGWLVQPQGVHPGVVEQHDVLISLVLYEAEGELPLFHETLHVSVRVIRWTKSRRACAGDLEGAG